LLSEIKNLPLSELSKSSLDVFRLKDESLETALEQLRCIQDEWKEED